MTVDWHAWRLRLEHALDISNEGEWLGLFAPGAVYADPHFPATTDLEAVSRLTSSLYVDWTQKITYLLGGDGEQRSNGSDVAHTSAPVRLPMACR